MSKASDQPLHERFCHGLRGALRTCSSCRDALRSPSVTQTPLGTGRRVCPLSGEMEGIHERRFMAYFVEKLSRTLVLPGYEASTSEFHQGQRNEHSSLEGRMYGCNLHLPPTANSLLGKPGSVHVRFVARKSILTR
jgi:hypothetical protein